MIGVINRLKDNDAAQTLGHFILYNLFNVAMQCKVLELPDKENQRRISRIPAGWYTCVLRYSTTYGWHYILLDVKGRDYILIHFGNYKHNTQGCLLFGNDFVDINGDGHLDVTSSKKTMKKLLATAPKEFKLLINDLDKEA